MPFVMPLFVHPKKVVVIISPLNALEEDQAQRFRDVDLSATHEVSGATELAILCQKDLLRGRRRSTLRLTIEN
ncbi:hypothetical protein AB1N83_012590 [Pleurotus pulmonarius]